jgi:hypothetical protein
VLALPKSRRKTANLNRDPRAAVVIFDANDPYESAQAQGTTSLQDDPDGTLIDQLSHKYTGGPYPGFAGPNPQSGRSGARVVLDRWGLGGGSALSGADAHSG